MAETKGQGNDGAQAKPLTREQIAERQRKREEEAAKAKKDAEDLRKKHEDEAREEADHAFLDIDSQLKHYAGLFTEKQRRALAALLGFGVDEPPFPTAKKPRAKKGEGQKRVKKNPDIYEVGDRKWNGIGAVPQVFLAYAQTPEGKKFREANPTTWPAIGSGAGKGLKTVPKTKSDGKSAGAKGKA